MHKFSLISQGFLDIFIFLYFRQKKVVFAPLGWYTIDGNIR